MVTRDEILAIAGGVISGERDADYGDAKDNFQTIAALWSSYLDRVYIMLRTFSVTVTSCGFVNERQDKNY